MFEKYTEKARRTIFFARYEASTYGSRYIEVPHLLLGLLREVPQVFSRVSGVERPVLQKTVEAFCTKTAELVPTSVDLPLSHACKRALGFAGEEAGKLSHQHIGTEHLLLGVLREDGPEAQALGKFGITLETVHESMVAAAAEVSGPPRERAAEFGPPVTRETAQDLLAKIPDERLAATARLLAGLSCEFFTVAGASSSGRFAFSFGKDPRKQPPAASAS